MNKAIEQLQNNGMSFYGDINKLREKQKTLVVLGVARGGTSVLSGTLDNLGVFTGERSREPVFEDVLLAEAVEENNTKKVQDIIEKYNNAHDLWAFKRPSLLNNIKKYHAYFRNPIYLVVFRDIYAIANRNNISVQQDIFVGLEQAQKDYAKIIEFLKRDGINYMTFSYEKILQNQELFVDTLVDLLGKERISQNQIKNAKEFIAPSPVNYLHVSRNTRSEGRVETNNGSEVSGWGKYILKDEPAEIELYINEQCVKKMTADLPHSVKDGYGFSFSLSDMDLKAEDKVSVKLADDVFYLNGSQSDKTNRHLHKQSWFTQNQLNTMLKDQYKKPDFLRDIAVILRDRDDMENAYKVISKALELRPQGSAIVKLEEEIREILDQKGRC